MNMKEELTAKRVAIVGGGLAGALNALYLGNRGYKVDVYESKEGMGTNCTLTDTSTYTSVFQTSTKVVALIWPYQQEDLQLWKKLDWMKCYLRKFCKLLSTTEWTSFFIAVSKQLNKSAAEMIFKVMILPALDHCDVVWQGCGKRNIDSLKKLQRRAARLIHLKSGIETKKLLSKLKLIALKHRWRTHTVIFVKKCLLGTVPPYMLNYSQINQSRSRHITRNHMDITLPRIRLKIAKRSFFYTGATEHNRLPHEIKAIDSFKSFCRTVWTHYTEL